MLKRTTSVVVVSVAVAAAVLGYVCDEHFPIAKSHAATPPPAVSEAPSGLPDFTQLVDSQGPAVVNISVTQRTVAATSPVQPGDPMYDFFRRFQNPQPDAPAIPRHGLGSGFII